MSKKIAVVGAGISGLACAYELQKKGADVTVFEKNDYVGGRMASREKNRMIFDIGADHLIPLYKGMTDYCEELGVKWEKMRFEKYGIYRDGKIRPMKKILGIKSRFRVAKFIASIKKEGINWLNLEKAVKYDDEESAYDYIQRELGQEVADYFADPFCSTYQFHSAKEISRGAMKAILESTRFSRDLWPLHRTEKGMSALPEAIAKKLNLKLSTPINSVQKSGDQIELIDENENKELFDAVVLACTSNVSNKILKNPSKEQSELLQKTKSL